MSGTDFGKKCLVHHNAQHLQVRKDFFDLCAYDKSQYNQGQRKSGKAKRDEPNQECMAKILHLLEQLTNLRKGNWQSKNEELIAKKRKPLPEPREYRIELAYSTIVRLLYNTCGESTVRNSITALLHMNYIKRYQKTKNSIPEYVLNVPIVQQALNDQHTTMQDDEVLFSTPENDSEFLDQSQVLNSTAQGVNSTPEPVKITAQGVNSTPNKKENNKTHNIGHKKEEENSQRVQPPTQTPALSSPSSKKNVVFEVIFTQQEEALVVAWEVLSACAAPRTEKLKAAAKELVRCGATKEDLIAVRDYCLRTNGKWYAEHGMDLTTIVSNWSKWKSTKSIPNQQRSSTAGTATTPTSGMDEAEAQAVARDAIEKGKTHGYDIKAHAVHENGVWVVRIDWDGDPLRMRSQAEWDKTFQENYDYDQQQLLKGAK